MLLDFGIANFILHYFRTDLASASKGAGANLFHQLWRPGIGRDCERGLHQIGQVFVRSPLKSPGLFREQSSLITYAIRSLRP